MDIVTLIENSKGKKGLANEWGLSLHIEANGQRILFDTGASSTFLENSQKLGIDVSKVDMAVLSHGHYDHAGGLSAFFSANRTAPLYLRTTADGDVYGKVLFGKFYVGLDQKLLKAFQARLVWIRQDTEISPGIHILTSMPDSEFRPSAEGRLLVKTEHGFLTDTFTHELALLVKEDDGMSVITGCGHLGVLNMVLAASNKFPNTPIKAVIGGFHLTRNRITGRLSESPEKIKAMALRFKALGCSRVITGHCTSSKATSILMNELPGVFTMMNTGSSIHI